MTTAMMAEETLDTREQDKHDAITFAFEKLIKNDKIIQKAVSNDDDRIIVKFNGVNPNANAAQRVARTIFPLPVPTLEEKDILENPTFQKCKTETSFNVELVEGRSSRSSSRWCNRIFAGGALLAVATAFADTVIPLEMQAIGYSLSTVFMASSLIQNSSGEALLKITPKPTAPYKIDR